ncbi:MAG: hypothetical protein ACRDOK_15315 [Streptosporangiaceae bacterium]
MVSHRQAQQAREELAAGGLSHQDQRRLRAVLRSRAAAAQKRRGRLRHLTIAAAGAIVAMAIATLSFGLGPAIDAAGGGGMTGSFVVSHQVCSSKTGCQWVGTFQGADGDAISGLAYGGLLPAGEAPGSIIAARYPGGSDEVYALHGSHTWVFDLLITLVIGAAAGAALWISPLGEGGRNPEGVSARA